MKIIHGERLFTSKKTPNMPVWFKTPTDRGKKYHEIRDPYGTLSGIWDPVRDLGSWLGRIPDDNQVFNPSQSVFNEELQKYLTRCYYRPIVHSQKFCLKFHVKDEISCLVSTTSIFHDSSKICHFRRRCMIPSLFTSGMYTFNLLLGIHGNLQVQGCIYGTSLRGV